HSIGSSGASRRKASPRTPPLTARSRCNPLKLLFYGTPAFALPAFEALRRRHDIVAVITQPDRPAHRGQRVTPPPVKQAALAVGLPVLQPPRLRDPGWPERLAAIDADRPRRDGGRALGTALTPRRRGDRRDARSPRHAHADRAGSRRGHQRATSQESRRRRRLEEARGGHRQPRAWLPSLAGCDD